MSELHSMDEMSMASA